ncbi:hypothetical protein PLESTB_001007800 [Pleodorina starrii]|uniref:CRAL-TRIO domain-containing protein n=1 Tax=Pleodorina starrii TaxID=330485 RepID=A0A9W6F4Q7_9CHLO|nr:hypothetical protein PLESTB_001007800 [Pleodorina starrii]GLC65371.1 hypothetical protein PLESTF_000286100 [Pleodorina starrii]
MWSSLWSSSSSVMDSYTEADALWYLNPTAQQRAAMMELRSRLQRDNLTVEGHDDDYTLLRFLMARDFNVEKAFSMYRDMRAWRLENRVDGLYESDPSGSAYPQKEKLLQVYPHFYFNTDKFGRPVYIELLGRTDASALFATINVDDLIRYHIWTWERYLRCYLPACSTAAGRHICTTTVIIDLAGLSLMNFNSATQKLLSTFSKIDQDYYPEHLGNMFVINTPMIFRGIWAAVQPLLQERTRKKIVILGSDYLPTLTQMVPLDRLPDIFGGKMLLEPYKSVGPWQQQRGVEAEACADARVQVSAGGWASGCLEKLSGEELDAGALAASALAADGGPDENAPGMDRGGALAAAPASALPAPV